jgi:hypothetical protein
VKQLFTRRFMLIFDGFAFGVVGFFAIVFSRHRQRIGERVADAAARPVPGC